MFGSSSVLDIDAFNMECSVRSVELVSMDIPPYPLSVLCLKLQLCRGNLQQISSTKDETEILKL